MDAECRDLFERFERDVPHVRARKLYAIGRGANRHANPVRFPRNPELSVRDHENAWLALAVEQIDFVAVSHSFDGKVAGVIMRPDADPAGALTGRLARLLPGTEANHALPAHWRIATAASPGSGPLPPSQATKPVIFVLPALFAVGGVERNAVDIMNQLRGEFDFVVITTEPLSAERGSLHKEAVEVAHAFYDLAELAHPDLFETMLARLRDIYSPVAVWICNGSPWQCDHATAIRDIFAGIPITDQQVYDTEIGWITRFAEPGMRSADRFIATNSRIRDTFVNRYHLPADRIDLIYPAVNLDLIGPLESTAGADAEFVWIGRLTAQKRPLEFLRFAAIVKNEACFVMIGDGELASECDAFIARENLTNVRRIPFSACVSDVLRQSAAQVITSKWEGLPIAMLESLAMGLPVFSTGVGDIRIVLEQYGNGVIGPDASDPQAFAHAWLAWRSALPQWRERARKAAPAIRERFGGPAAAALYKACWQRAIAQFSHALPGGA
ncbi:MAG: glycosyltransferase family 4 protein [Bryobacteraceae bacterium]